MTPQEKQQKLIEDLVLDLQSADEKTLLSAIKRVKSKGTGKVLPFLFRLIENENTPVQVKKEATRLILELKDTSAIPELLNQLTHSRADIRELALQAFWHSGFNPVEHVDKFVRAAIAGSYMEAVEVLTILDNLEPPLEEVPILESQMLLKKYFGEAGNKKEEKQAVLTSISALIDSFEQAVYTD